MREPLIAATLPPVLGPCDAYIHHSTDTEGVMPGERADDRAVLKLTGGDRLKFLNDLVTNDLRDLGPAPRYAALLTPQGKYLVDFFVFADGSALFVDVKRDLATALLQRLSMYRLRADVQIEATDMSVSRGLGVPPEGAFADPRSPALGWRAYDAPSGAPGTDWDAIRVAEVIPETGIELIPNESYILECGFERLNGVNFRKGCYVGQEVTARMKHKTELRKGLARVELDGAVAPGTPIERDGKAVGTVHTVSGMAAIAYLRLDQTGDGMVAGGIGVRLADGNR
jgi:folate-binding protein YgfZ